MHLPSFGGVSYKLKFTTMNDNDLQGFASFIDSLYHRPTDDSRDYLIQLGSGV